jgi:hypothetical protein
MTCRELGKNQSWPNQGTILEHPGGTEENHKKLVRMACAQAEICTVYLPSILEHYC